MMASSLIKSAGSAGKRLASVAVKEMAPVATQGLHTTSRYGNIKNYHLGTVQFIRNYEFKPTTLQSVMSMDTRFQIVKVLSVIRERAHQDDANDGTSCVSFK